MTREEIRAEIVARLADIDPAAADTPLGDDSDLREELDLDSMDILNLATALHDSLGIDVPERDYPELTSLGRAVAYVEAHLDAA